VKGQAVLFLKVRFQSVAAHGLAGLGTTEPQDVATWRHRAEIVIETQHAMDLCLRQV
jgi:hypothetical protein